MQELELAHDEHERARLVACKIQRRVQELRCSQRPPEIPTIVAAMVLHLFPQCGARAVCRCVPGVSPSSNARVSELVPYVIEAIALESTSSDADAGVRLFIVSQLWRL